MTVGITQKITSIKLAFLVRPDDVDSFNRAIEIASFVWGGFYSPIIPFFEKLPVEYRQEFNIPIQTFSYYIGVLNNYDPDIIIYDDGLPQKHIEGLANERQIFTFCEFKDLIDNGHPINPVNLKHVLAHLSHQEFRFVRNDNLRISIPKINTEELFLKAYIGTIPDNYRKEIADFFNAHPAFEEPELTWESLDAYYSDFKFDIKATNRYELRRWHSKPYLAGKGIYCLNSDRLQDIINYWNLRALGWEIVPIPINRIGDKFFDSLIDEFVNSFTTGTDEKHIWFTLLIGHGFGNLEIEQIKARFQSDKFKSDKEILFGFQTLFPRFWAYSKILDADHARSTIPIVDIHFEHTALENERVKFTAKPLSFKHKDYHLREPTYKLVLDFSYQDDLVEYAGVISGISTKTWRQLVFPLDSRHWRLSPLGIHRFVDRDDAEISLSIPKALEFFKEWFKNKGHKLVATANSKLANEVLRNIGGIYGSRHFQRAGSLKVIEQFESGNIVRYEDLLANIKRHKLLDNEGARTFIEKLLDNKVVEIGAVIKCSVCDQHGFFLPSQLDTSLTCPICRNIFSLPMTNPKHIGWAYRGIGPFSRTNKADGVMSVFACLRLFHDEFTLFSGKITALIGFELLRLGKSKESKKNEVDLSILIQPHSEFIETTDLLLCECKTYKNFEKKDIDRMMALGNEFPGAILTLATLNESLTVNEVELINELVRHFQTGRSERPRNPVLILTGSELLPDEFHAAFKKYKNQIMPYQRHNDFIGSLCDLSIKRHLSTPNWADIQEIAWSDEIARRNAVAGILTGIMEYSRKKESSTA